MNTTIKKEIHFIAHYLAKFPNSYGSLALGNNTQTHKKICKTLDIKESSFRRLRDEYDGFYKNRKGFPNPRSRKSRVKYKKLFEKIEQNEYIQKINRILFENSFDLNTDEQTNENLFYEGTKIKIEINKYERSSQAKEECLKYYKRKCILCGFEDKSSPYAKINIIEVHHLKPLSEINEKYIVNPIEDLRPVCPNCHRALHSKKPTYSIDELKNIMINNCT